MCNLRHRLFSHLMHQEIGFFDRIRTGELMNRLSEVSTHLQPALHQQSVSATMFLPTIEAWSQLEEASSTCMGFINMTCLSGGVVDNLALCCMVLCSLTCVRLLR